MNEIDARGVEGRFALLRERLKDAGDAHDVRRHIGLTTASLDTALAALVAGQALNVATLPEPRSPDRFTEGMSSPPGPERAKELDVGDDGPTLRVALLPDEMVDRLLAMSSCGGRLHAVFGYLERPADAGGITPPLLLVPVSLTPHPDRSGWKLTMTAAPRLNPVLVRHLAAAGPVLPGFDVGQSWWNYSAAVEASVAEASGWRVRSRLGLGRIDTALAAIRDDLDRIDKPLDRPILASLLVPPAQKPVHLPPGPGTVAQIVPPTIDTAEQARVVLEAVEAGRAAVVKADPGSDTAGLGANLIAAGLAKGRSVLCVAPAPAIARIGERLAAIGLGPFCLTLTVESDAAGLLRHLEGRFALRPARVEEAAAMGDELGRVRERLRTYAERVASRSGRPGRTLFDLIWCAEAAGRRPGRGAMGVETPIETPAAAWHEALHTRAAEAALAERFRDPLPEGVAGLIAAAAELPPDLVRAALQAGEPAELLTGMEGVAVGLAPLRAELAPWLSHTDRPGVRQAALRAVEDFLAEAPQAWPSNLAAADLASGAVEGDRVVQGLRRLDRLTRTVRPALGLPTLAVVGVLRFLVALPEVDPSAFDARFLDANARRLLKRMIEVAEALTAIEAGIEQRFRLDALPSIIEAERHRQALAAGGVFAAFKASVKAARAAHAGLLRRAPPQQPSLTEVEADLRHLVSYLQARADFASNGRYRALLGEAFKGHRSDFRPFERAARLAERATSLLDDDVATALLQLPAAVIEDLRAALDDASIQSALRALPDGVEPAVVVDKAEAARLRLRRLHAAVEALGLRPETTRAALLELRGAFTTYFETATIRYGPKPLGVDPDGLDPGRVAALQRLLTDPALKAAPPALRTALVEGDPALGDYLAAKRASAGAAAGLAATGWLDVKALYASATGRDGRIAALERAPAFAEDEAITDRNDPALVDLDGATLDAARARFARLDARARTLDRAALAADLAARPLDRTAIEAVRDLEDAPAASPADIVAAGDAAVLALCPGLLATPEAVARHLPSDLVVDLVVIDGVDYVPPEGALAALGRGRRAVLVGSAPTARDDADKAVPNLFALGSAAFGPPLRLSSPDLDLDSGPRALARTALGVDVPVLFPSPRPSGVRRHAVAGRYDPDAATNPIEARAVATRAVACLRAVAGRAPFERHSICALAFGRRQAELIRRTVAALIAEEPAALAGLDLADNRASMRVIDLDADRGEPHDVVLVSTTYGPTLFEGQDLGSLDRPGGLDRLGALIARAERVELFTSLDWGSDRAAVPAKARSIPSGTRAALHALLAAAAGPAIKPLDLADPHVSDLARCVGSVLAARGYNLYGPLGAGIGRLELAVGHPDLPGRCLFGILTDAPTVDPAAVLGRDRAFERLGWQLWRVWSIDWLRAPDAAAERLCAYAEGWLDAARAAGDAPSAPRADAAAGFGRENVNA